MSETHVSRGNSPIVWVAIASWIGTSIEWWDFILYGTAAALVLGPLFFSPKLSPLAAQLSAFATFWVGFAARPVALNDGDWNIPCRLSTDLYGHRYHRTCSTCRPALCTGVCGGRRMGWRSAASDRTFTCSQARVLRQLAAAWCPDRASALIVDLQCSCIILPNDRFSGFWLEDTLPAQYCASRCRFIYPAEDCRNA